MRSYISRFILWVLIGFLSNCKSVGSIQSQKSELQLISGGGRTYPVETGISVCFSQTIQNSGWSDVEDLNKAVQQAIEAEWGQKVGVILTGWKSCDELPDALVKINFFDCTQDGQGCPDGNRSPHVAFIGPPGPNQRSNTVNLRRTYQDHYRFDECNGRQKLIAWTIQIHKELDARKRCARNYAIHEFGHILGFDHEQYHPDGPEKCNDDTYHFAKAGSGAARWLCSKGYDDQSVMNYCGKVFLNWDGGLSKKDIDCAKEFFAKMRSGAN